MPDIREGLLSSPGDGFIMKMNELNYSKREIARKLGVSESTIRYRLKRLQSNAIDRRSKKQSGFEVIKDFIRRWIEPYQDEKRRPTYKLLHHVLKKQYQVTESYDALRRYMQKHFSDFHHKPVWIRVETPPGAIMFVDWKEDIKVQLVTGGNWVTIHALIISLGFSGKMAVCYFENKDLESFISGHQKCLLSIGGMAEFIRPDCLKSAVKTWKGLNSELNSRYLSYVKMMGITVYPARPGTPTDKGKVEKRIRDFFGSVDFKHEVFADLNDLQNFTNTQLEELEKEWRSSATGLSVADSFSYESKYLKPLPDKFPQFPVRESRLKVRFDGTVAFCNNLYQVEKKYVGSKVLCVNTGSEILIYSNGKEIERYAYLPLSKGMVMQSKKAMSDPEIEVSAKVREWSLEVSERQLDYYYEISQGGLR